MRRRISKSGQIALALAILGALSACSQKVIPTAQASVSPAAVASVVPAPAPAPTPTPTPKPSPVASSSAAKKAVATAKPPTTTSTTQQTPPTPAGPGPAAAAAAVLGLINQERASAGLPALSWDGRLVAAATRHDALMANGCGAQIYGCGDGSLIQQVGNYDTVTANVGDLTGGAAASMDAVSAGDAIHQAMWHEGPGGGHYDNIVRTDVNAVGIGVFQDANGGWWLTEYFHSTV